MQQHEQQWGLKLSPEDVLWAIVKPTATLRLKIGKPFVASGVVGSSARRKAAAVTTETMVRIARMLPEGKRGAYTDKCGIELKETSDFTG